MQVTGTTTGKGTMQDALINAGLGKNKSDISEDVKKSVADAMNDASEAAKKPNGKSGNGKKKTGATTKKQTAKKASTKKVDPEKEILKANRELVRSGLGNIRDADKAQKTLSNCVKNMITFWNEGYKDAFFDVFGLTKKEFNVPTLIKMWPDSLRGENSAFLYEKRQQKVEVRDGVSYPVELRETKNGKTTVKKVYETIRVPFDDNFTPRLIFKCLLVGKHEREGFKF